MEVRILLSRRAAAGTRDREAYGRAFAPDGLRCAAAGLGKVVIWDVDV